jgi:hypothetical protein
MSEDPMTVIQCRGKQAAREARTEDRFGDLNGLAHYVFGIVGVVGGATAAALAGDGDSTWIVVAGIAAAAGSGAITLFSFKHQSALHYQAAAALQSVADHAENEYARLSHDSNARSSAPAVLADVQKRLDSARRVAARIPGGSA